MKTKVARIARRRARANDREGLETRALIFLCQGRFSAGSLARKLGVSEVTAKRIVQRLRRKGEEILSVRSRGEAYYEVRDRPLEERGSDPFLRVFVPSGATHAPQGKFEDRDYDVD